MQLLIVATDGGGATATSTASITVLRNLNDPTFVNPIQERSIEENYPLNQIITTVEARDADVTVSVYINIYNRNKDEADRGEEDMEEK